MQDGWYYEPNRTHLFFKYQGGKLVRGYNINCVPDQLWEGKIGYWPTLEELEEGKPAGSRLFTGRYVDLLKSYTHGASKETLDWQYRQYEKVHMNKSALVLYKSTRYANGPIDVLEAVLEDILDA